MKTVIDIHLNERARGWRARSARIVAGLLLFVVVGLYAGRHLLLTGYGHLMEHEDVLAPADVIVVLSGNEDTRPFHAAALYREGLAPRVAITNEELTPTARLQLVPPSTQITRTVLAMEGVPDSAIVLLSPDRPVTSTRDEAAAVREYVEDAGIRRMIVVTSTFHTARARFTVQRALSGDAEVLMSAAPEWQYDPERWWESERGITDYGMEALKWIHTLGVLR